MLSIEEMQRLLQDRRIDKVMEATGLSRDTIADIRDGKNLNPQFQTAKKLSDYLMQFAPRS